MKVEGAVTFFSDIGLAMGEAEYLANSESRPYSLVDGGRNGVYVITRKQAEDEHIRVLETIWPMSLFRKYADEWVPNETMYV